MSFQANFLQYQEMIFVLTLWILNFIYFNSIGHFGASLLSVSIGMNGMLKLDNLARLYDANMGRFVQANTIMSGVGSPEAWDRFSYSNNNPIYYTDPSGHMGIPPDVVWIDSGPSYPLDPIIIPRSSWGANEPGTITPNENAYWDEGRYPSPDYGYMPYSESPGFTSLPDTLDTIVIHYEDVVSIMDYGYSGASAVKRLQEIEMENGLYDIPYHYLIDPEGNIYEGRNISVRGAHVSEVGHNTGKIGVLWVGVSNSRGGYPTPAQVTSTAVLIMWLDRTYGINEVGTHREFEERGGGYTECPGDKAIPSVNRLKKLVLE
jgi:RHS repeat-associated protein